MDVLMMVRFWVEVKDIGLRLESVIFMNIFIMIGFIILEYIKKFGSDIDIGMV